LKLDLTNLVNVQLNGTENLRVNFQAIIDVAVFKAGNFLQLREHKGHQNGV
jgi:hypothetical protein